MIFAVIIFCVFSAIRFCLHICWKCYSEIV